MSEIIFEARQLFRTINQLCILNNISLTLPAGSITGILGTNASSKTTLLKALGGIIRVDSGTFYIKNKECSISSPSAAARLGIHSILSENQLHRNLSIPENIFLNSFSLCRHPAVSLKKAPGIYDRRAVARAAEAILNWYGCPIDITASVSSLNADQKLILLAARALAGNAQIILIDDCFFDIVEDENDIFHHFLQKIASEGRAVVFASQNLPKLQSYCDRILTISEGALNNPKTDDSDPAASACHPFPYPKLPCESGEILYECEALTYQNILHDISLHVREGEIVGILGETGSGRTTLACTINGYLKPSSGRTAVHEIERRILSPAEAKRNGITLIQNAGTYNGLIPNMSVQDNIVLSNLPAIADRRFGFFTNRHKMRGVSYDLARRLGIPRGRMDDRVKTFSNGFQKKIAFAKTVFSGCQLFLLDEPTREIDYAGRIQIYSIITELAAEHNGILLFTSDVEEALGMCDRIYVLSHGIIRCEVTPDTVTAKELHHLIYTS